jgi:hypothetical protein
MIKWENVATAAATAIVMTIGAGAISKFTDGSIVTLLGGVSQSELAKEAGLSPEAKVVEIVAALKDGGGVGPVSGYVPSVGNHPETKAIVAYFSEKGERSCPAGWSPYEDAKDRFILGAGGKIQTVGEIGGEEEVALKVDEMPAHDHGGMTGDDTTSPILYNRAGDDIKLDFTTSTSPDFLGNNNARHAHPIQSQGSGRPHNNMPPYIALYFCKKD